MSGFKRDPQFDELLFRSQGMRQVLEDRCEAAAPVAAELAPDDPRTTDDDLRSSVAADVAMTRRGFVGRVLAEDWKAHFFENGTVKIRPRPFLRPAVEREVGRLEAAEEVD
jgi:HK97 gp10 family phage protein